MTQNTHTLPAEVEKRFDKQFFYLWQHKDGQEITQHEAVKAFLAEEIERARAECSAEWEAIVKERVGGSFCCCKESCLERAEQTGLLLSSRHQENDILTKKEE